MPSQDTSTALPLIHAPDGVGYRLIELPQELVDDHSEWSLVSSSDGLARLCAAGRTYTMRQKNTSNALMLLSGHRPQGASSDGETDDRSVSAIATLHETVELAEETIPVAPEALEPAPAKPVAKARGKWHEKFGRTR